MNKEIASNEPREKVEAFRIKRLPETVKFEKAEAFLSATTRHHGFPH